VGKPLTAADRKTLALLLRGDIERMGKKMAAREAELILLQRDMDDVALALAECEEGE
jgi:hypothetical protein